MTAASGTSELLFLAPGVAQDPDSPASGHSQWRMVLRAGVVVPTVSGASGHSMWSFGIDAAGVIVDPIAPGPFRSAAPAYGFVGGAS